MGMASRIGFISSSFQPIAPLGHSNAMTSWPSGIRALSTSAAMFSNLIMSRLLCRSSSTFFLVRSFTAVLMCCHVLHEVHGSAAHSTTFKPRCASMIILLTTAITTSCLLMSYSGRHSLLASWPCSRNHLANSDVGSQHHS